MAEGYEPQPAGIEPIYMGQVTDLNIANRPATSILIGNYLKNTTNAPDSNKGGWFIIFTNKNNTDYGIQFSLGDGGYWTRSLTNGTYSSWQVWKKFETATISGTTDTRGNINSGIGSGKIIIGFTRDSNGYDGVYIPFHSAAGVPYIHVTDWDGAKATSVTVSGTVYYMYV